MSRRILAVVLGAFAVATIAACTRAPYLTIFNAAGTPLVVRQTAPYDGDMTIAPGQTLRARFPDAMNLTVTAGAATWRYAVKFPPRGMASWSKLGTPTFQLQVEPDGRVWVLPPDSEPPVRGLPAQPDGFPLVPTE